MPVPKGQEARPGLIGGCTDGGLPVLILLPNQLVGGDLCSRCFPIGLFALLFDALFFFHQYSGLLFFGEFFGGGRNNRNHHNAIVVVFGKFGLFRGASVSRGRRSFHPGDNFPLRGRDGGQDLEADNIANGKRRRLLHRERCSGGSHCHADQRGVHQEVADTVVTTTKETGLELGIVEFQGSVFQSSFSGNGSLGRIDHVLEDDRQCFELQCDAIQCNAIQKQNKKREDKISEAGWKGEREMLIVSIRRFYSSQRNETKLKSTYAVVLLRQRNRSVVGNMFHVTINAGAG
jgi:hypothetical protein